MKKTSLTLKNKIIPNPVTFFLTPLIVTAGLGCQDREFSTTNTSKEEKDQAISDGTSVDEINNLEPNKPLTYTIDNSLYITADDPLAEPALFDNDRELFLVWESADPSLQEYRVSWYASKDCSGPAKSVGNLQGNHLSIEAESSTYYSFFLEIVDDEGNVGKSECSHAILVDEIAPTAPALSELPRLFAASSEEGPTLHWDELIDSESGTSHYEVAVTKLDGKPHTDDWISLGAITTFELTADLKTYEKYQIHVRAVDNAGNVGEVSVSQSFVTVATNRAYVGTERACSIKGGGVFCWGLDNLYGEIGSDIPGGSLVPVAVDGLVDEAISIEASGDHTCALLRNGQVMCWGRNSNGQLGNGTREDTHMPSLVQDLNAPVWQIAVGLGHTCALSESREVYCWGSNGDGELGDGTLERRTLPVKVLNLNDAIEIKSYESHNCASTTNNNLYCWGRNSSGQLGTGSAGIGLANAQLVTALSGQVESFGVGNG